MGGCLLAHDIHKHGHSPCKMPQDVAVEEPHTGVVGAEPQYGVSAARDLESVSQDSAREVVGIGIVIILVVTAA